MLRPLQLFRLVLLSVALWLGAALLIRFFPQLLREPRLNLLAFVAMAPVGWACVLLIERGAGLLPSQLLGGVGVVGAVAMMIDGLVLTWAPEIYGPTDTDARLGAAWLLWGYGVTLAVAVVTTARRRDRDLP